VKIIHCPACGYSRQPTDTAPSTECPQCGVVFSEFLKPSTRAPRQRPAATRDATSNPSRAPITPVAPKGTGALNICKDCGTAHYGDRVLPGSGWIELVLWLAWLVPGIIYSIWRRSNGRLTCPACGSRQVVLIATPVGAQLARQYYPDGIPPKAAISSAPPSGAERVIHSTTKLLLVALGIVFFLGLAVPMFFR
jgi:predicted RNA-binding Zn-ribbon protein involved in translation (DUF1610 family)